MAAVVINDLVDPDVASGPVKNLSDKWRPLPHFLAIRGLMEQHIDSLNFFVLTDIKKKLEGEPRSKI